MTLLTPQLAAKHKEGEQGDHLSDLHQSEQEPHTHTFKQICKVNAPANKSEN